MPSAVWGFLEFSPINKCCDPSIGWVWKGIVFQGPWRLAVGLAVIVFPFWLLVKVDSYCVLGGSRSLVNGKGKRSALKAAWEDYSEADAAASTLALTLDWRLLASTDLVRIKRHAFPLWYRLTLALKSTKDLIFFYQCYSSLCNSAVRLER